MPVECQAKEKMKNRLTDLVLDCKTRISMVLDTSCVSLYMSFIFQILIESCYVPGTGQNFGVSSGMYSRVEPTS